MSNISKKLAETIDKFIKADISDSKLNAELLLCKVLECNRFELFSNPQKELNLTEEKQFDELVEKRLKRVPLQYLEEKILFYDLELKITKDVLIPRSETEELVALVCSTIERKKIAHQTILDIGTGSGCISLAIAKKFPNSKIIGIDKSKDSIALANENKQSLQINNVDFLPISVEEYITTQKFDIIVSNPPYVSLDDYATLEPELFFEPKDAITDGSDGLYFYKVIHSKINKLLKNNAYLFLEIASSQAKDIKEIFSSSNLKIIKDINGLDRMVSYKYSI